MKMEMISISSQRSSITPRAIINQLSREQESPHSKIGCRHGAIVLRTTHIDCFLGPPFVDPRVWQQRGTDVWVVIIVVSWDIHLCHVRHKVVTLL
jgi:hypothetical protein